jgi:hypothetical protein
MVDVVIARSIDHVASFWRGSKGGTAGDHGTRLQSIRAVTA